VEAPHNPNPIPERIRLVIALTEVNSRYLRGENRCAGAEIELACALAYGKREGATTDHAMDIPRLQAQLNERNAELQAIEVERDWLENELVNFDSVESRNTSGDLQ
jgi:hypothetical protein